MVLAAACGSEGADPQAADAGQPTTTLRNETQAGTLTQPVEARLSELADSGFNGLVAVGHQGTDTIRAFGTSDRSAGDSVAEDTIFDIGSITKQFTAAGILRLQMDGLLSVDDPVGDYVDGLAPEQRSITLHQLLSHTSGLNGTIGADYDPVDLEDFVELVAQSGLRSDPGAVFEYSNVGYSLLAATIESVSGVSYEQYLADAIFEPAGMTETGYVLPDWDQSRVAVGYDPASGDDRGRPNELPWAPDGPYWHLRGNGGLLSSAQDMLNWGKALAGDDVLDQDAKDAYFAPHVDEGTGTGSAYAYGWTVFEPDSGAKIITHNGGNGIFFADYLLVPDEDLVVYMATNSEDVDNEFIAFEIADLLLGTDYRTAIGGAVDSCGFTPLSPTSLPDGEVLEEFPETDAGQTVEAFVEVTVGGDAANRESFAADHVDPALSGGAPAAAVAGELAAIGGELGDYELVSTMSSSDTTFHLLFESSEGQVLVSVGTSAATPDKVQCLAVSYG